MPFVCLNPKISILLIQAVLLPRSPLLRELICAQFCACANADCLAKKTFARVTLPEVDLEVIEDLLDLVYTGNVEIKGVRETRNCCRI